MCIECFMLIIFEWNRKLLCYWGFFLLLSNDCIYVEWICLVWFEFVVFVVEVFEVIWLIRNKGEEIK